MSDSTSEETDTEAANETETLFDQPEGVDWFLAHLVGHSIAFGTEMGLTLTVGGSLISGTLISVQKYFEGIRELTLRATAGTGSASTGEGLAAIYGEFAQMQSAHGQSLSPLDIKPRFIHLKDARMVDFDGGQMPTEGGNFWRGKLSDVSGFMIGSMGPN